MSIEWFIKQPGNELLLQKEDELAQDGCLLAIGDPDWVRIPEEMGGGIRRVLDIFFAPCPAHCDPHHSIRHYALEGGINVAECDQFYWYERKESEPCTEAVLPPT